MRALIAKQLAAAGAVAMLVPSDNPAGCSLPPPLGSARRGRSRLFPSLATTPCFCGSFSRKGGEARARRARHLRHRPYRERNVIAELPGSALKDEVVWLAGTSTRGIPAEGADDDGSGVAAVLEAARILKALNVTPLRTIRFAFFSGEEQACLGSRAYVAAHEKGSSIACAPSSSWTLAPQAPLGFHIQGRGDLEA